MIKTTLGIEGMMCGMCESHINNAIRNNFKVKKVNSSKNNGQTEIISEDFVCYVMPQNMYHQYNFAIDYGYNQFRTQEDKN